MLVRWSIWGEVVSRDLDMLVDSVQSFRNTLGSRARYLIHTDQVESVRGVLPGVSVRSYSDSSVRDFDTFSGPTWAKWCPQARLAPGELEVLVDSDVFLLDEPTEVLELMEPSSEYDYAILAEVLGARWQRGCFASQITADIPFINAGLVAQGPRGNIGPALSAAYKWWQGNILEENTTFHDEQGAVTLALMAAIRNKTVLVLPASRYAIVSPRSNPEMASVKDLALLHATYPDHPAYLRFRDAIRRTICQR